MNPESLDSVLAKKDSLTYVWALLNPKPEYHNLYNQFMREWNRRSHRQQQQFYWFVREKIRKHQVVHDNPLYALCYIHPHPTNWNGKLLVNRLMKENKLVSAFYNGSYGIYTLDEARVWQMTERERKEVHKHDDRIIRALIECPEAFQRLADFVHCIERFKRREAKKHS